jgi:uncharacterized protein YbjT (DUF2867 family)
MPRAWTAATRASSAHDSTVPERPGPALTMRVAVAGGTGLVGARVVEVLRAGGHEARALARSRGVDLMEVRGLDEALEGVDAVVDALNPAGADAEAQRDFFGTTSRNLLSAEERAGVRHHVVLSIVGLEKVHGNPHYAGKQVQEELVAAGPVPSTILRATQFHDFAAQIVERTLHDGVATVPPLLVQPVAVSDVADALAQVALGAPRGRAQDLAGPDPQDLVDMARRTLAARGRSVRLVPSWDGFPIGMAGDVLLPGPDARIATTSFEDWLAAQTAEGSGS